MNSSGLVPRWACPPGETIREAASDRGLAITDLAGSLGLSLSELDALIRGRSPITLPLAENLSAIVGASSDFWMTRDAQYHDDLRRVEADNWAQTFPVKQMAEFGWITKPADWHEQIDACLKFFGVDEPADWAARYEQPLENAHFRRSPTFSPESAATTAWFRAGEAQADTQPAARFDVDGFVDALPSLRKLTTIKRPAQFVPRLISACAEVGVRVVVVRAPKGCPISGVARSYRDQPLIQLSARHLSDDHFWFSMFHEAGHVVLHPRNETYVDGLGDDPDLDTIESEANAFATKHLIPAGIKIGERPDKRAIIAVARANGVSPGVIVGQLQHRKTLRRNQFNDLKRFYTWNGTSLEMK